MGVRNIYFSDASNADVDDSDLINKSQIDYLNVPLYLVYGEYQMQRYVLCDM